MNPQEERTIEFLLSSVQFETVPATNTFLLQGFALPFH
jgi:hypothetical protein